MLTESVLLAALGGFCGLLLAVWGTDFLVSLVPENIPRAKDIHLDGVVLAFTFLASLGTGILFGLAPALQSSRLDLRSALNESSRGSSSGSHHRLRSALVVLEVALALLLLTGAGLLLQSFARLSRVNPGVQPERLFTSAITLSDAAYPKPEKVAVFQDQLLTRVRALPGVNDASTVFPLPLSGSNVSTSFDLQERPKPEGNRDTSPLRIAGSNYFHTMGISLVRGRLFDQSDRFDSKPVIIINQRFAEKFFPNENPIGKTHPARHFPDRRRRPDAGNHRRRDERKTPVAPARLHARDVRPGDAISARDHSRSSSAPAPRSRPRSPARSAACSARSIPASR